MKSKVVQRKGSTITVEHMPYSLQAGDVIQFYDSSGRPRGEVKRKYQPPTLLILALAASLAMLCFALGILIGHHLR